jgi:dipeptidyl aminopeptidase/acylaminoacyl peptidase
LSWSADGAWIAFVSRRDGNSEVYVVDAAGENLRNVSQHPGLDGSPAWAPDGRQLAFESIRDGNMEVYAVDVTGGAPVNMSNHPLADGGPAWAPDGSALAFASNRDGDWDILAVDVDVDVYVPEDENEPDQPLVGDVNADGVIDFVDLALISLVRHGRSYRRGRAVDTRLDVNEDGVVDITDLVVAAASYGQTAEGAETSPREPSRRHARMIKRWIKSAQRADDGSDVYRRGLETLDRLLAMVKQGQTVLHRNFPNPFNPETWVPFELEEAADVTLVFYDAGGRTIRRLELGNRAAGEYTTRGTAAYWDGRDVHGEPVGSGVYFVELRAGSYRQTRRLLVRK